jgi:hypothetical protein
MFPYAVYAHQGSYDKVKAAVVARYATLAKLLDAPEAKQAPAHCDEPVKLHPKVPVLSLDNANIDYNLGMSAGGFSEKNARTTLENLEDNPVNAVFVTRKRINPDVYKGIGGLISSDVAIIDSARSKVLCRTDVTSKNSKEIAYTITTESTGAQTDNMHQSATDDLGRNQAKDVSAAVQKLLAPATK